MTKLVVDVASGAIERIDYTPQETTAKEARRAAYADYIRQDRITRLRGILRHNGNRVGFYGAQPVTRPTVEGLTAVDRLRSLEQALEAIGLIERG